MAFFYASYGHLWIFYDYPQVIHEVIHIVRDSIPGSTSVMIVAESLIGNWQESQDMFIVYMFNYAACRVVLERVIRCGIGCGY